MDTTRNILRTVWLLSLLPSCYSESSIEPDMVITGLSATPVEVPADGTSKTQVAVELPTETTDANLSVVLTTSLGFFEGERKPSITVSAQNVPNGDDNRKIAYANLISPLREGEATITARTHSYTRVATVKLTRALPEAVRLSIDKLYYKPIPNEEVTLIVRLARSSGVPSLGSRFTLTVTDSLGRQRGTFRNLTLESDSNGQAVNKFSILDSGFKGSLKAKAATRTSAGLVIADSVIFFVIKP